MMQQRWRLSNLQLMQHARVIEKLFTDSHSLFLLGSPGSGDMDQYDMDDMDGMHGMHGDPMDAMDMDYGDESGAMVSQGFV